MKPTVSRCAPLALQLFLQLGEEAPVGALGDELLGGALQHPGLVQAQGVKTYGVLGVILTPLGVRDLLQRLEGVVVPWRITLVYQESGGTLGLEGADVSRLQDGTQCPFG